MKYSAKTNVLQDVGNFVGDVGTAVDLPPDQSTAASEPYPGDSLSGEEINVFSLH